MTTQPSPPKQHVIEFRSEWPVVRVTKRDETRRDHLTMVLVSGLVIVVGIFEPGLFPVLHLLVPFLGFVMGYAFHAYISHNDLYEMASTDSDNDPGEVDRK